MVVRASVVCTSETVHPSARQAVHDQRKKRARRTKHASLRRRPWNVDLRTYNVRVTTIPRYAKESKSYLATLLPVP